MRVNEQYGQLGQADNTEMQTWKHKTEICFNLVSIWTENESELTISCGVWTIPLLL